MAGVTKKGEIMNMNEYQDEAYSASKIPHSEDMGRNIAIWGLGIAGEAGEVADHAKKALRDDGNRFTPERAEMIADELGDVLWYVAALARAAGFTLEDVALLNLYKLHTIAEGKKNLSPPDTNGAR